LAVNKARISADLRQFLPRADDLKAICDYELGPDAIVPHAEAQVALETGPVS